MKAKKKWSMVDVEESTLECDDKDVGIKRAKRRR